MTKPKLLRYPDAEMVLGIGVILSLLIMLSGVGIMLWGFFAFLKAIS